MKKCHPVLKANEAWLKEQYGQEKTQEILALAEKNLKALCEENSGEPKPVKKLTNGEAYPNIALYRAMEEAGVDKGEALAFLDRTCSLRSEPKAEAMRNMLKIPGLYRKMPAIFKWVTVHQFGPAAGYAADFYDVGKSRVKFDMTRCLYWDVCRREGCPELTACFCHTDDVTNSHMHPKICWHRTETLGEGGTKCDFDLRVTDGKN